ncbi:MAG: trypsin-like serine protease [Deltaproteobacteria bacterium]|nr:trypsin-like serine protease [Deltaproteobacteria bacterium]
MRPTTLFLGIASLAPALLGGCLADVGADARSARALAVVGGSAVTDDGAVGPTVSLFFTDMGDSGCTGTLVAPRVVATAAHCLAGVDASILEIVTGAVRPADADASHHHAVASLTPHPEFTERGFPTEDPAGLSDERDIGVVVLAADVPGVTPAPVLSQPSFDVVLTEGTDIVLAGFGLTADDASAGYGQLNVATAPFSRRSASEMLVGGPGLPDTCNGDSGGPAYVEVDGVMHLAGITSRGSWLGDGSCGNGGIYTLFGAFADFVAEASGGAWSGESGSVDLPPPPPPPENPASCAGSCEVGVSYDGSCYCDPLCEVSGDCCADFRQACPAVGSWTCPIEDLDDEECDCGCGLPDPSCAEDACVAPPDADPADEPDDAAGDANADDSGDNEPPPAPTGCAAGGAPLPPALVLVLLHIRRRRSCHGPN